MVDGARKMEHLKDVRDGIRRGRRRGLSGSVNGVLELF
jgi:hypothetical protein